VHEGDVNAVLVYSPDRLSRKYAHQLILEMEFQKTGTELIFFNTPRAKIAEEQLSLHFKSIFAEYERAQITERCSRGRLYRAKQGNISTLPHAPYGYVYNRKVGLEKVRILLKQMKQRLLKKSFPGIHRNTLVYQKLF
jgi:site-specific DNA recombinase